MSWHYSQALVAAYSAENSLAGEPSAPSSSTSTPEALSWPGKTTDASNHSQSGTTCEPSTEDLGAALLTWFRGAFPARTYPPQDEAQESPGSEADCGKRWPESLAKYDPDSRSWKTHQCSLFGGLESFSETWPRWGMMRDGECWALTMPEHLTSETGSGLWPTPATNGMDGGSNSRKAAKARGMWPTPRAQDREGLEAGLKRESPGLGVVVRTPALWPTPRANDGLKRGEFDLTNPRNGLAAAEKMWPTPCASEARQGYQDRNNGKKGQQESLSTVAQGGPSHLVGGSLNPTWVEWLMGWPLGWTDCAVSATDRFRQWLDSHGKPSTSCSEPVTT